MIAIVIVAAVLITNNANKTPSIGYNELISKMENGEIKGVYFTGVYKVNVLYTKEFNESKDKDGLWSNFIKGKAASATAIVLSRERVSEAMDNAAKMI